MELLLSRIMKNATFLVVTLLMQQILTQQPMMYEVVAIRILPSSLNNDRQQIHQRRFLNENTIVRNGTTTSSRKSRDTKRTNLKTIEPLNVVVPTSPDDHLVTTLPLLDPKTFTTKHWAGHLPANNVTGDKYFFYWLFEPDLSNSPTITSPLDPSIPIIIWLNGGPACSSMDGLFIENGPFRIVIEPTTNQYKVIPDDYSWHKLPAYTLYIDQPVGTGLSITSSHQYPTNDEEVNIDIYYFMQQFLRLHSDKFITTPTQDGVASKNYNTLNRKLFFSGESYAGHYIPSFIRYLLQRNKDIVQQDTKNSKNIHIPVAGAAIGNGWTDPYYQYSGAEFAYGLGIIDYEQMNSLKLEEQQCQEKLNNRIYDSDICFNLIENILLEAHGHNADYKLLGYDVRQSTSRHEDRVFPPGHKVVETYLGGWSLDEKHDTGFMSTEIYLEVLNAIHASAITQTDRQYTECTDPPYNALSQNDGKGVVDDVIEILNDKSVNLLFFNGVYDIVCNHIGNERLLNNLNWHGANEWRVATRYAWYANNHHDTNDVISPSQVSGYMKEYDTLQFLKINNAGHMVPVDVPAVAFDMMYTLITEGKTFHTRKQDLDAKVATTDTCPTCPTCYERDSSIDASSTSRTGTSSNDENSGALGAFIISYAWLVAGVALIVFFTFMGIMKRRHSNNVHSLSLNGGRHRGTDRIPIAQHEYDIELREHSAHSSSSPPYRDDKE